MGYAMPGGIAGSWMGQGLAYYPTIPITFEGRWNGLKHVLKSTQPYSQSQMIPWRGSGVST